MAAPSTPVVTGVPTSPVVPGTIVDFTATSSDPDAIPGTPARDDVVSVTATKENGETGSGTIVFHVAEVPSSAPVVLTASLVSGSGTVTKTGPNAFRYVA